MNPEDAETVVPATLQVTASLDDAGAVVLTRALEEREKMYGVDVEGGVSITVPRMYVPALIQKLQQLLASGG